MCKFVDQVYGPTPLGARSKEDSTSNLVAACFEHRLARWKRIRLSKDERLTLIKIWHSYQSKVFDDDPYEYGQETRFHMMQIFTRGFSRETEEGSRPCCNKMQKKICMGREGVPNRWWIGTGDEVSLWHDGGWKALILETNFLLFILSLDRMMPWSKIHAFATWEWGVVCGGHKEP